MISLFLTSLFGAVQLFGWLLFILPVFESLHFRFFQRDLEKSQSIFRILFDWYGSFLDPFKMRRARDARWYFTYIRKSLLFAALVLVLFGLAILPVGMGSQTFSPYFLVALLFCIDMIFLIIGFTFEKHFVGLSCVEQTISRQSALLVLTLAFITTPNVSIDLSLSQLVEIQAHASAFLLPAWGAVLNPVAFFCACFVVASYLDHWREDTYPLSSTLRKSAQSEFVGMELAIFRMTRSLEYLLIYALIVIVFLGGPRFDDNSIDPIQALLQMSLKIFIVATCVLLSQAAMPRLRQNQRMKFIFLVLLPLELASYPLSLLVRSVLNLH